MAKLRNCSDKKIQHRFWSGILRFKANPHKLPSVMWYAKLSDKHVPLLVRWFRVFWQSLTKKISNECYILGYHLWTEEYVTNSPIKIVQCRWQWHSKSQGQFRYQTVQLIETEPLGTHMELSTRQRVTTSFVLGRSSTPPSFSPMILEQWCHEMIPRVQLSEYNRAP